MSFGAIDALQPGTKKFCITLGRFNYEALKQCGFKNVIFVSALATPKDLDDMMPDLIPFLDGAEQVFIDLGDSKIGQELCHRIDSGLIAKIIWPPSHQGADVALNGAPDGTVGLGKTVVRQIVNSARPVPVIGIFSVKDIEDDILDLYRNGDTLGVSLGYRGLTTSHGKEMFRAHKGVTTSIAGIPGMGKSRFTKNMMVRLAKDQGWVFGFFDKETKPRKTVAQLCAIFLEKPFRFDALAGQMDEDELRYAMKWVDEHFKFIRPEKGVYTVDDLLDKTSLLVKRYGISGLTIDAYNNLNVRRPKGSEAYEYLADSLEKMNDFREAHDLMLNIVVHPPKLEKNKRGGYDAPSPYEAMGGSHFRNKMDEMITVHRNQEDQTMPVEFHFQKVRDEDQGIMGVGKLLYDPSCGIYYDGIDSLGLPIYGESVIEAIERHKPMTIKIKK